MIALSTSVLSIGRFVPVKLVSDSFVTRARRPVTRPKPSSPRPRRASFLASRSSRLKNPSIVHPSTPRSSTRASSPPSTPPRRFRSMGSPASHDFPPLELRAVVEEVTSLLKERNESVSVAETAAGGLISSSILSTPGASSIYKGGLTVYTLPMRVAYAGWTQETIANYKGPTTDIVAGLASHTRRDLQSTYALSESGTAGPTGGNTPNRTPGYVALAVDCERGTFKRELNTELGGDRTGNMIRFAVEALKLLRDVMRDEAKL